MTGLHANGVPVGVEFVDVSISRAANGWVVRRSDHFRQDPMCSFAGGSGVWVFNCLDDLCKALPSLISTGVREHRFTIQEHASNLISRPTGVQVENSEAATGELPSLEPNRH